MHVHVGVEEQRKVIPILECDDDPSAHLQALSSSSTLLVQPGHGLRLQPGDDVPAAPTAGSHQFSTTGPASSPLHLSDMLRTGVIDDFSEVRWDIRPSPKLGTIEIRTCDAPTNVTELKALATTTRTAWWSTSSTEMDEGRDLPRLPQWFVAENKWRSARYGMDAILILDAAGNEELVSLLTVAHLLDTLEPVAAVGVR